MYEDLPRCPICQEPTRMGLPLLPIAARSWCPTGLTAGLVTAFGVLVGLEHTINAVWPAWPF